MAIPPTVTPTISTGPAAPEADRLVDVQRYLHRFDRSQTVVLVVRTFETASGERYRLITHEPWEGL